MVCIRQEVRSPPPPQTAAYRVKSRTCFFPPSLERPFNWWACSRIKRVYGRTWTALCTLCSTMCHHPELWACFIRSRNNISHKKRKRWTLVLPGLCCNRESYRPGSYPPPPPPIALCALPYVGHKWQHRRCERRHFVSVQLWIVSLQPGALTFCCRLAMSVGCFALNG